MPNTGNMHLVYQKALEIIREFGGQNDKVLVR